MLLAVLATTELILLLITILPIIAIFHLLTNKNLTLANKLILAALIIFIPIVGILIYVFYNITRPKQAELK
jgi:drug/metabolite transporter (DMT)-like permease